MNQKLWFKTMSYAFMAFLMTLFTSFDAAAQITYSEDFDAGSASYTGSFSNFSGATTCSGSGSGMRDNIYSGSSTGNLTSPSVGTSLGGVTTLSYDYKVADWSANTTGSTGWGSFDVEYASSASGPWTTAETVDGTNHVVSGACATRMVTFTPSPGALYVRFNAVWAGGDYYLNFDNISVSEVPPPPCSGTPAPGNTISSAANVCSGESVDLSLQNITAGSGVTYQWESADDAAFTMGVTALGTASTENIAAVTAAKYYRCTVTCSGMSATSTAVMVGLNPITDCYCTPVTANGCTDGDVIAQVILNDLNNNSGTGCPSGLAGYSDYTDSLDPSYTTTLVAGNSYNCQVWAGQWSESYAAWIDFNNDGVFDNATENIGYTSSAVSGSGSVGVLGSSASFPIVINCNPTPGTYRLRVRAMFSIAGSSMTPCGNNSFGEVEDYLVTIAPPLPCPAPSALVASNETDNSVDLSWNIGCAETAWNIIYGPTGFDPLTSGTSVAATMTTATVAGLACNTGYDFYVQADCGATDGVSLVSAVAATSTTICPCMGTPAPGNTEASVASACPGSTVALSLQNDVSAVGISYQWESADDAAFTINVQTLGTNATESVSLTAASYYRCVVTCAASGMTANSTEVLVNVDPAAMGDVMGTAIPVPAILCIDSAFVDTVDTDIECYSNVHVGRPTNDVYYTFTLTESTTVEISTCDTGFDTYLYILDGTGTTIHSNDDNGPVCSGTRASLNETLGAGTYFIVAEGYSSNGELIVSVSTGQNCNACSFPMVLDNLVSTTSTTADVTWSPSGFTGTGWYELEYKETASGTWLNGGTVSTSATSKFFSGLNPNTSYDVRGRVLCSAFEMGPWSSTVTFSTPILQDCALSPVLMASTVQGNYITVSWTAVPTAGWYELRYKESASGTWLSAGSASGSATSKTISGLTAGTSYDFEGRTYCTNGIPSAWGGLATATTTALAGCELPPVLDALQVSATLTSVTFSWTPAAGGAWYAFQYREVGTLPWIAGGSAGGAATMKTRTGLMPSTSYEVQARTYCPTGAASAWSSTEVYSTDGIAAIVVNSNPDKVTTDVADKSLTEAGQITKVYPNPATDKVNVEINLENASDNTTLRLMDMSGRVVRLIETQTNVGVNTITMDLQDLSNGMYTLLVYDNNSLLHTSKVKKN